MAKKNTLKTKLIETRRKITMFIYGRQRDWEFVIVTYWKELRLLTYQEFFPFHDGSLREDVPIVYSKHATQDYANKYFKECSNCAKYCEDYDWTSFTDTMCFVDC